MRTWGDLDVSERTLLRFSVHLCAMDRVGVVTPFATSQAMILWSLAFFLLLVSLLDGAVWFRSQWRRWSMRARIADLEQVRDVLRDFKGLWEAGILPEAREWRRIGALTLPWGEWIARGLCEHRDAGTAALPSIRRWIECVEALIESEREASVHSAQARGQAACCLALVPLFALVLYAMLPSVSRYPGAWALVAALALVLSGFGAYVMLHMTESARWCGLKGAARGWCFAIPLWGERIAGLIRSGQPADLAWTAAFREIACDHPELALLLNEKLWEVETTRSERASLLRSMADLSIEVKKSIHVSLYEGRGAVERIEAAFDGWFARFQVERKECIQRLGTALLRPLFVFVAPSLLIMLAAALALEFLSTEFV